MKLITIRIYEYKSIWDSNNFEIGDITCLVGKNEAGKTALLQAIYKLNPIITTDSEFNVTNDYPRVEVSDYEEDVKNKKREPAKVVEGTFELQDDDIEAIITLFGEKALKNKKIIIYRKYSNSKDNSSTKSFHLEVNDDESIRYLIQNANIPISIQKKLIETDGNISDMLKILTNEEGTEGNNRLKNILESIKEHGVSLYICNELLHSRVPKFLYFDEYYQMKGCENIEILKGRQKSNTLKPSDYPMLGLIGLSSLDLDQLLVPSSTQNLVNKLEGAGNRLSKKVLQYWSQNKHIQMRFDVRPAQPNDPIGLTSGTNIWANVYDSRHMVSTNLGTRSRGFIWFFSFLAWYSKIKKENEHNKVILLLDEPGLFLHGKAQEDLLNYFEKELKDKHQIIYTTHSPFMVDSAHFERVRIVQDKGIDSKEEVSRENDGTKVFTDVLEAQEDSLFPLQGALGYEIYQTLFVGKNCLVVEGISDLIYIQSISELLKKIGREGLSANWTITPVGGSGSIPAFISLLGSQKGLNVATLIDYQKKDTQMINNIFKKKLLKKKNVITFTDFMEAKEADIEDMFGVNFYLKLVNNEYENELENKITAESLNFNHPRILVKIEEYLKKYPLQKSSNLSHYRIARYFVDNCNKLIDEMPKDAIDRFEKAFSTLNKLL